MSGFTQPTAPQDAPAGEVEQVGALPVLAGDARAVHVRHQPDSLPVQWRTAGTVIPAVQAAAVAAGGFVAGAAVVGLVHRRQRRSAALARGRRGRALIKARPPRPRHRSSRLPGSGKSARAVEIVQIVGSRSLLLDVHLLGSAGDR